MGAANSQVEIFSDCPNSPIRFNDFLVECIKKKDIMKFQTMFEKIENPQDGRDCRGASLLHVAADIGNDSITKYLISAGFNINLQDEHGRTPLAIALKRQNFRTANILLKANADIWICDTFGINALQIAVTMDPIVSLCDIPCLLWRYPYWQSVAMIFDRVDSHYLSDSEKIADALLKMYCPLTHVVFMKNLDVMKIMIEKGSSINVRDRFTGFTALHLAICFWKLDKVKLLLNHGADVNILAYHKTTPLMCIYHMIIFLDTMPPCEIELLTVLLKEKLKMFGTSDYNAVRQMHDIFRFGTKDAVRVALEIKPDLFLARYVTNHSLLHILTMNPNPGIEEVIKGRNMEVDSKNHCGDTALAMAVQMQNCNLVESLIGEGASIDSQNEDGITPMHWPFVFKDFDNTPAAIEKRLECINVMLEHGGDPEITFSNGDTILKVVARNQVFALAEPVLAQLAVRQMLEMPISQNIQKQIKEHNEYQIYFQSRVVELEEAKTSVIWRSVTVFDFLTVRNELILLYARNRYLVSKLVDLFDRLSLDSYYMSIIRKRSSKVLKIAEFRKKATEIVREIIGKFYEFNPVITDITVDYLDDEDVQKLLETRS